MSQLFFSTEEINTIAELEAEKTALESKYKKAAATYIKTLHAYQSQLTELGDKIKAVQTKINSIKQPNN